MKTAFKALGMKAAAAVGAPRVAERTLWPGRLSILMYHAVAPAGRAVEDWCFVDEADFRAQMLYLRRHFEVLPLVEAVARLREGTLRRPAAAITFDDGYQNNHDVALPILRELGLPATIYLCTGLVGTADTVWFGRLVDALAATRRERLEWRGLNFYFSMSGARARAGAVLQAALKELPHAELLAATRELIDALGGDPDRLIAPDSPFRMLDAPSIERLAASGLIEFGAHTESHTILTRVDSERTRIEIQRSVAAVERLTGRPCRTFAYPNGRRRDYDETSMETLAALGIEAAVTTTEGPNERATPPLELRRYGIGRGLTPANFQWLIHHGLSMLRRVIAWK